MTLQGRNMLHEHTRAIYWMWCNAMILPIQWATCHGCRLGGALESKMSTFSNRKWSFCRKSGPFARQANLLRIKVNNILSKANIFSRCGRNSFCTRNNRSFFGARKGLSVPERGPVSTEYLDFYSLYGWHRMCFATFLNRAQSHSRVMLRLCLIFWKAPAFGTTCFDNNIVVVLISLCQLEVAWKMTNGFFDKAKIIN